MPRNQLSKDELKCYVLKLKNQLYESNHYEWDKKVANEYLNKVLDKIEEYNY